MQVMAAEWYYIGHYGQLGPLTREQMDELIEGGVIERDTYVWNSRMSSWTAAGTAGELASTFLRSFPVSAPPPPPMSRTATTAPPAHSQPTTMAAPAPPPLSFGSDHGTLATQPYGSDAPYYRTPLGMQSDKSRTVGGILNLLLPGVGRMYLGYPAIGVIQLVLTLCSFGVLAIWPIIDGILMLVGNLKHDGYGRVLKD